MAGQGLLRIAGNTPHGLGSLEQNAGPGLMGGVDARHANSARHANRTGNCG